MSSDKWLSRYGLPENLKAMIISRSHDISRSDDLISRSDDLISLSDDILSRSDE